MSRSVTTAAARICVSLSISSLGISGCSALVPNFGPPNDENHRRTLPLER